MQRLLAAMVWAFEAVRAFRWPLRYLAGAAAIVMAWLWFYRSIGAMS